MSLDALPEELTSHILSFLSLREIASSSSVSSTWRHAIRNSLPVQYEHNYAFKEHDFYPTEDYTKDLKLYQEEYAKEIFHEDKTKIEVELIEDGLQVVGLTIPALLDHVIQHLVNNRKINENEVLLPHEGTYLPSVFFYTYQSYMTEQQLFYLLFHRFEQYKTSSSFHDLIGLTFVMEGWIRHYIQQILLKNESFPVQSVKLIRQLLHFIDKEMMSLEDESSVQLAIYLRGLFLKEALQKAIKDANVSRYLRQFPIDKSIHECTDLFTISVSELAKQLTIQVFETVDKIEPHEFCGYPWRQRQHKCPNIMSKLRTFEEVYAWVATCIVKPDTAEERAKVMRFFIRLCMSLLKLRNFDTIFCILGGLTCASVFRLKNTKALLLQEDLDAMAYFEEIVSFRADFSTLRTHLQSCSYLPTIPYYGLFLGDLKSVWDYPAHPMFNQAKNELEKRGIALINVYNLQREYHSISILQRWRFEHSYYPLENKASDLPDMFKVAHIQELIHNGIKEALPVQQLFQLSLTREPR